MIFFPAILFDEGEPWPKLIFQIGYREKGLWGYDSFSYSHEKNADHRQAFDEWIKAVANDLFQTLNGN